MLMFGDLICLTETWVKDDEIGEDLFITDYEIHPNNCDTPKGKGIIVYERKMGSIVQKVATFNNLQITLVSLAVVDVFVIYRSASCTTARVVESISSMLNPKKAILICGDMNICFKRNKNNGLIQFLLLNGFVQKVPKATHIDGGLIDHVYFRRGVENIHATVSLYSTYYTANDHDALLIELNQTFEEANM